MCDYANGKIYMITSCNGLPYIGSTIKKLITRFNHHKKKNCTSKIHIGATDCEIKLIENYPCNNKNELLEREKYWINKIECCNNNNPIINHNEFLEYQKEYYENNKNNILQKRKEYREKEVDCYCGRIIGQARYNSHLKSTIHFKSLMELLPFCQHTPIRS